MSPRPQWLLAALVALPFVGVAAPELRHQELAEGVLLLGGGQDGNVLVVTTAQGTLLVDSRSPASAAELLDTLAELALPPVRWVVNTHYHEDHRGANPTLAAAGARLLSRAGARVQMQDDATIAEMGWTLTPAPSAALPGLTLTGAGALHLGERHVQLGPLPPGHTDADLAVQLLDANVLHAGDQVESENYPFLDIWHGGRLAGLIEGVDALIARCDEDTIVVPGHGPVVDRQWLRGYREMLADVLARVRAALAEGQEAAAFLDAEPTSAWDGRYGTPAAGRRLAALAWLGETRSER